MADNNHDWQSAWEQGQKSILDAQKTFIDLMQKGKDATPADWAESFGQFSQMYPKWTDFSLDPAFANMANAGDWFNTGPGKAMQEHLLRMMSLPKMADLPDWVGKGAEAASQFGDYQKATVAYGMVMSSAWQNAFDTFYQSDEFKAMSSVEGDVDPADLFEVWLKLANKTLLETQGSPEFLAAQKALFKASLQLRKMQIAGAQAWAQEMQLPDRVEADDMIATLDRLRREVQELRAEVSTLKDKKNG